MKVDNETEKSLFIGGDVMKRFHIHIGVEKLEESIHFYSALFGANPVKRKTDYAQWFLDDPRVNFAISTRAKNGMDHMGIQVEQEKELTELRERFKTADMPVREEGETVCCYARSEKSWVQDPGGIPWEAYRTMEDAQLFSVHTADAEDACCTPETMGTPDCCVPSERTTGCCG
jgi:catechol 2,3-dioxygenase-like lactoylglutathione lyase family enzyme